MKTISLPIFNRPDALRKMLESLKRNNTEGWKLYASIDGGNSYESTECLRIIEQLDWMPTHREFYNIDKLGLSLNTFLAPSLAFAAGSDFNLYLEDDLLLSPDVLDLCNWYYENHWQKTSGSHVGLVLWRAFHSLDDCVSYDAVSSRAQGGHGNGFACTRYQWETFWRKEWFGYGAEGPGKQYDIHTDIRLRELGLNVLSPLYPRSVQQRIDGMHGKVTDENPLSSVQIYDGTPVKEFRIV